MNEPSGNTPREQRELKVKYQAILLSNVSDAIVATDMQYNIQYWNTSAESQYGWKVEEVLGYPLEKFISNDYLGSSLDIILQKIEQDGYWKGEVTQNRRDGVRIPILSTLSIIKGDNGQPLGFVAVNRNISERKRAEEALRKSEERYRTLFSTMVQGVVYQNAMGEIISANPAAERILGLTLEQLQGRTSMDPRWKAIHEDESDFPGDMHPSMVALKTGKEVKNTIMGVYHPVQNTYVWININATPLFLPGETSPYQVYTIFEDITERKRVEEALRESEWKYRTVAEFTHDCEFWLAPDGHFLYISPACERITGYTCAEFYAAPGLMQKIVHPDDQAVFAEHLARDLTPGTCSELEFRIIAREGVERWIGHVCQPVYDQDGSWLGRRGSHRDITGLKTAEAVAEQHRMQLMHADKMASLGTLISGIAHEINNPNNFVMLNADIFADAWRDVVPVLNRYVAEQGDFSLGGMPYSKARTRLPDLLAGMKNGAERIKRIVDSLKEYVRNDETTEFQQIDIHVVIDSAIVIMDNLIKKSTDSFSFNPGECIPLLQGNMQQLEQVIINMLSNACQALSDRDKAISITTSFDRKSKIVAVRIHDEGHGISERDQAYIFDPFYTTRRESGGTGLGLPISQSIITAHKGFIKVESIVGQGTTVSICLPVKHPSFGATEKTA